MSKFRENSTGILRFVYLKQHDRMQPMGLVSSMPLCRSCSVCLLQNTSARYFSADNSLVQTINHNPSSPLKCRHLRFNAEWKPVLAPFNEYLYGAGVFNTLHAITPGDMVSQSSLCKSLSHRKVPIPAPEFLPAVLKEPAYTPTSSYIQQDWHVYTYSNSWLDTRRLTPTTGGP